MVILCAAYVVIIEATMHSTFASESARYCAHIIMYIPTKARTNARGKTTYVCIIRAVASNRAKYNVNKFIDIYY